MHFPNDQGSVVGDRDQSLKLAAANLGTPPYSVLITVTPPLSAPITVSARIFTLLRSSEYLLSIFLAAAVTTRCLTRSSR